MSKIARPFRDSGWKWTTHWLKGRRWCSRGPTNHCTNQAQRCEVRWRSEPVVGCSSATFVSNFYRSAKSKTRSPLQTGLSISPVDKKKNKQEITQKRVPVHEILHSTLLTWPRKWLQGWTVLWRASRSFCFSVFIFSFMPFPVVC